MTDSLPVLHPKIRPSINGLVLTKIDIQRKTAVLAEEMGQRSIQIGHVIMDLSCISIWKGKVRDQVERDGKHIKPAASYSQIEGGLARNYGTFELKPAVEQAYVEGSPIVMHITCLGRDINHGGKLSSESGGEAALVKVQIINYFRIE